MPSIDPSLIVRVDIDAKALRETLAALSDVAQQLADLLILARDLLDDAQAATQADGPAPPDAPRACACSVGRPHHPTCRALQGGH